MYACSQLESDDEFLTLLVTEKRERDVLGQIVVPLSNVDYACSPEPPLRVPLQPGGLCSPHSVTASPGELVYSIWITARDLSPSVKSRTTSGLRQLRRKLNNNSPLSSSRWNEIRSARRHSVSTLMDLHSDTSPSFYQLSFDDDGSCPTTAEPDFMAVPLPEGYVKRSSLPGVHSY